MTGDGPIFWLASYPKSGSTWLRAQLTALLSDAPVDLGRLIGSGVGDRHLFADATGLDSAELGVKELGYYRSLFHANFAGQVKRPFLAKVHDRYSGGGIGEGLFPAAASAGAIYIVRNPLDVAASFAHHNREPLDRTIVRMNDASAMLNWHPDGPSSFLPVELGGWSAHVAGWTGQRDIPLLLLRYEDMSADPEACLSRVARFAGIEATDADIADAVSRASFGVLQRAEREQGFSERPAGMTRFFRNGRAGSWREELTETQAARIRRDHAASMAMLGYI